MIRGALSTYAPICVKPCQTTAASRSPHSPLMTSRLVVVEAAAGLAAEEPGLDHAGQQWWGRVERLLELLVERVGDGDGGVEPDEVGQVQRSHRVGAALDHAQVDVLGGGEARLEHADGGEEVRDQQRVDDEAGPVLGPDDRS